MKSEYDLYIPPHVTLNSDGSIPAENFEDIYHFDYNQEIILINFSGYGSPEIEYITQRGPFQQGVSVLDYRLNPRVVRLLHRRTADCREQYWNNRAELLDKNRPNRQLANTFNAGILRKIYTDLNGEQVRDLKALLDVGPLFRPSDAATWDEYALEEDLRFIAFDPILTNPAQISATWVLGALENLVFYESPDWEDRLVFQGDGLNSGGIWFGETSLGDILNVTYTGTFLSFPTIIITGPLENVRILNNTTDEKIELNYDISVGETVTINLDYGVKTIQNNFDTNLLGTATSDSDIATFHIAPYPEAPGGVNELQVFGDGAVSGQTEVRITYNERYFGI